MNPPLNSVPGFLIATLALVVTFSSLNAGVVTNTKDGITITAEATQGPGSRILVRCVLTNGSPHLLASVYPHSVSKCFQFRLLDIEGNHVLQRKEWALQHAQIDLAEMGDNSVDSRGLNSLLIYPDETSEFLFYLEDAYGEAASKGNVLEIGWYNYYTPAGGTITIPDRMGSDGKIVPKHEEVNQFPGVRKFTVSLPLPERPGADAASPTTEELFRIMTQKQPAPRAQSQVPPAQQAPEPAKAPATRWWWALLTIPLLLLAWLGLRLRASR